MKWLEETRGPKFELVRHFLLRMFDSEMFAARGQWRNLAIGSFALALPVGMLLLDPPYALGPGKLALAGQLALVTLMLAITGVLALAAWQSLFPSRRDYLALAALPVRPRQIFATRFLSVLVLAAGITLAMIPLPSLLAARVAARVASLSLGCIFVFFAMVAVQGVLINTLPARWFTRVSTGVQGALFGLFCLASLYSWFVVDWRQEELARLPERWSWAPPVWYVGLDRVLAGDGDPFFSAMAARGGMAAVGAVVLAALTYLAAYGRYRKRLLERPDGAAEWRGRRWSFFRLLARDPRRQAVLEFLAKSLSRSRAHRVTLLAYVGAGIAIMINSFLLAGTARRWSGGWTGVLPFVALYWPIGLSIILLAGVRHVFLMPVELPANWLFRMTESQGRREWMSAVERFVIGGVIVPVQLTGLPLAVAIFGWPATVRMTVLQVLVALTAFEFLFYSWQQLPFTCSYVPGKRPLVSLVASWLIVLGGLVPLLARIIAAMSQITELFLVYLAPFAAVWIWARRQRREGWGEAGLIYEDRHDAVADLGIKEMTYRRAVETEAHS